MSVEFRQIDGASRHSSLLCRWWMRIKWGGGLKPARGLNPAMPD